MKKTIRYFFSIILIASALGHLLKPEFTNGFIPDFLPKELIQILVFIIELALGIVLLIRKYYGFSAWAVFILMILFIPIHYIDLLREEPLIGSKNIASIRFALQFLLVFLAWKIIPKNNKLKA